MDWTAFQNLPHNQAAENNKTSIWQKLQELNLTAKKVLEVGSGTGQHGIYFCSLSNKLQWRLTETLDNKELLNSWYQVAKQQGMDNVQPPQTYAIGAQPFPANQFDLVYSANVLHIIKPQLAKTLVAELVGSLQPGQLFVCYGPFKQNNEFTTESNREFDQWLKSQGYGGLLDLQQVINWSDGKLQISSLHHMPANNFLVVYQYQTS